MKTREDIEAYLDRLSAEGATVKELEPGMWMVRPSGEFDFDIVVHCANNVVLLRVKVMDLPDDPERAPLYRRLLELNASDLVHGSYGVEQEAVVLTETLELSHLDYEEFQAAFESMTLSLAQHLRELGTFREAH